MRRRGCECGRRGERRRGERPGGVGVKGELSLASPSPEGTGWRETVWADFLGFRDSEAGNDRAADRAMGATGTGWRGTWLWGRGPADGQGEGAATGEGKAGADWGAEPAFSGLAGVWDGRAPTDEGGGARTGRLDGRLHDLAGRRWRRSDQGLGAHGRTGSTSKRNRSRSSGRCRADQARGIGRSEITPGTYSDSVHCLGTGGNGGWLLASEWAAGSGGRGEWGGRVR